MKKEALIKISNLVQKLMITKLSDPNNLMYRGNDRGIKLSDFRYIGIKIYNDEIYYVAYFYDYSTDDCETMYNEISFNEDELRNADSIIENWNKLEEKRLKDVEIMKAYQDKEKEIKKEKRDKAEYERLKAKFENNI